MRLQRYGTNPGGRDFVVGDLHGHYALLITCLNRVAFDATRDRLFAVGDLVDRGPESLQCLELAFEPWFHTVRGNHEAMMFDALLHNRGLELWMMNGGEWIYELNIDRVTQLCRRLDEWLPCAIEVQTGCGSVGLVHAQVPGDDWGQIEQCDMRQMFWSRERIQHRRTTSVAGIDQVVCGHTPVSAPMRLGNVHYIDTGAYFTGKLTLVELDQLCVP